MDTGTLAPGTVVKLSLDLGRVADLIVNRLALSCDALATSLFSDGGGGGDFSSA